MLCIGDLRSVWSFWWRLSLLMFMFVQIMLVVDARIACRLSVGLLPGKAKYSFFFFQRHIGYSEGVYHAFKTNTPCMSVHNALFFMALTISPAGKYISEDMGTPSRGFHAFKEKSCHHFRYVHMFIQLITLSNTSY